MASTERPGTLHWLFAQRGGGNRCSGSLVQLLQAGVSSTMESSMTEHNDRPFAVGDSDPTCGDEGSEARAEAASPEVPDDVDPARVAVISLHTSPLDQPGIGDSGGMNVYVLSVAERLAKQGIAVDIYTRCHGENAPQVEQLGTGTRRSEERRVGKECRSRWSP